MRDCHAYTITIVLALLLRALPCQGGMPIPVAETPGFQPATLSDTTVAPIIYHGPDLSDISVAPIAYQGPALSDATVAPIIYHGPALADATVGPIQFSGPLISLPAGPQQATLGIQAAVSGTGTSKALKNVAAIPVILAPMENQRLVSADRLPLKVRLSNDNTDLIWEVQHKPFDAQRFTAQRQPPITGSPANRGDAYAGTLRLDRPGHYRLRARVDAPGTPWSPWRSFVVGTAPLARPLKKATSADQPAIKPRSPMTPSPASIPPPVTRKGMARDPVSPTKKNEPPIQR